MLIELLDAFKAAVIADDVSLTVAGGTASVVQVSAPLKPADRVYFGGAGASAANDNRVRTLKGIGTGPDSITVEALPATPQVNDPIKVGLRQWLYYQSASKPGVYPFGTNPSPVDELKQAAATEFRSVLTYGDPRRTRQSGDVFRSGRQRVEFELYGRERNFLDGAAHRLERLFRGRPSALTVHGYAVTELDLMVEAMPLRPDGLQWAVGILSAALSRRAA